MYLKRWLNLAYQIFLYQGSGVPNKHYVPLLTSLATQNSNITHINTKSYSFFQRNEFKEDTILIGHSFGGYFALKDAIHDKERKNHRVKAVVLLNSHFNSRGQAPYFRLPIDSVSIPVLTLLAEQDDRLPLEWAIPDYWQTIGSKLERNRPFLLYPSHHHFTGLGELKTLETVKMACHINKFLAGALHWNSTETEYIHKCFSYKQDSFWLPKGYDCNKPLNILDYLFQIFWFRFFWDWTHFVYFLTLTTSPHFYPFFTFQKDMLIKSDGLSFEELIQYHSNLFPSPKPLSHYKKKSLAPNLLGLYIWLLLPTFSSSIRTQVFELQLPGNKTYFKIAHPEKCLLHSK